MFEVEEFVRGVRSGGGNVNCTEEEGVVARRREVDGKGKGIWRIW
jgi:hypothetical protein